MSLIFWMFLIGTACAICAYKINKHVTFEQGGVVGVMFFALLSILSFAIMLFAILVKVLLAIQ